MTTFQTNLLLLLASGLSVGALGFIVRRFVPGIERIDPAPWAATLSYVATAFGVVVGFSILFLFGQFASARSAVGDEATSIGTAFEQAGLFPESSNGIRRALICYSRSVPEYDWPAMRAGGGAGEVDEAFGDLVASFGQGDQPTTGALNSATATNMASQVGTISSARESRLVTAETTVPTMLWILLGVGAVFVLLLIFVVTLPAAPRTQALLMGTSAMFTTILILLVFALSRPYAQGGGGAITPRLIEETTTYMEGVAPDLAGPCV